VKLSFPALSLPIDQTFTSNGLGVGVLVGGGDVGVAVGGSSVGVAVGGTAVGVAVGSITRRKNAFPPETFAAYRYRNR